MIPSKEEIFLPIFLYHGICVETIWCYLCYLFYVDVQILTEIYYFLLHMSGKCGIAEIKCVREHDLSFPHGNKCCVLLSMESLST